MPSHPNIHTGPGSWQQHRNSFDGTRILIRALEKLATVEYGCNVVCAGGIRGGTVVMNADLKSMPGIVRSTDHYDSWLLALEPAFAHDLKQKLKVMAGQPGDFLRATF